MEPVNYSTVISEVDFSGKPLVKDPASLAQYFPDFDWNGVVLAGGSVLSYLRGEPINDFDFWLYGSRTEVFTKMTQLELYFRRYRKLASPPLKKFKYLYNELVERERKIASSRYNVDDGYEKTPSQIEEEEQVVAKLLEMNKVPVPYKRSESYLQLEFAPEENFPMVQLISAETVKSIRYTCYKNLSSVDSKLVTNALEVISLFDFSCCYCWFDGNSIWGTAEQVRTLTQDGKVTNYAKNINIDRLMKYRKKGFSFSAGTYLDSGCRERFLDLERLKGYYSHNYESFDDDRIGEHLDWKGTFSKRLILHNPHLQERLEETLHLTLEEEEFINKYKLSKRVKNCGIILSDPQSVFSYNLGDFIPVSLLESNYIFKVSSKHVEKAKECAKSERQIETNAEYSGFDLGLVLKDAYFRPGGPGFWEAVKMTN